MATLRSLRFAVACVVVLALSLVTAAAHARVGPRFMTRATPAAEASAPPPEEESPESPRASLRAYLSLCSRGRYEEAARYLDVPSGSAERAPELAHRLFVVLGERLWVTPDQLSPRADGLEDGEKPGPVELGRIRSARGQLVFVRMVRHQARSSQDESRWLFARSTVTSVDALYGSLNARWVRSRLPPPLLAPGPLSLYVWQWLAIPFLALICAALGRVFTWLTALTATALTSKIPWGRRIVLRLKGPVTMAWALGGFWALTPYLALTLRAEDLVGRVLLALAYLAFFWALFRAVAVAGDELAAAPAARVRPSIRSFASAGATLGKVVVAALAIMTGLSALGFPVTSIVAGFGIGGVVLALAAQKTVENLFGSISLVTDKAFRVGDFISVDGVTGTVEHIGLRSTRIRTLARTVVILPNGKLANMRIESYGPRDRVLFRTMVSLSRDATPEQVRAIVSKLHAMLDAHEKVYSADLFVRLAAFGPDSYDVDVFAPIDTSEWTEFTRIREELLLEILDIVAAAGATLALPTRRVIGAARDERVSARPSSARTEEAPS